jgi:hypothetical protein
MFSREFVVLADASKAIRRFLGRPEASTRNDQTIRLFPLFSLSSNHFHDVGIGTQFSISISLREYEMIKQLPYIFS